MEDAREVRTPTTDAPAATSALSRDTDGDTGVAGIDPDLLARANGLVDVPLADRGDAFDRLNDDVVAALRDIEAT